MMGRFLQNSCFEICDINDEELGGDKEDVKFVGGKNKTKKQQQQKQNKNNNSAVIVVKLSSLPETYLAFIICK